LLIAARWGWNWLLVLVLALVLAASCPSASLPVCP
jgi:hypothetical protein